jgi:hypothetical protein
MAHLPHGPDSTAVIFGLWESAQTPELGYFRAFGTLDAAKGAR